MRHNIINAFKVTTLAIILSFGLSFVYAWTAPTVPAPAGNVAAPINTSAVAQTKAGDLTIGSLTKGIQFYTQGTYVDIASKGVPLAINYMGGDTYLNTAYGNVGVGAVTLPLTHKLTVAGGVSVETLTIATGAGAGKVLTSDANGNATWQTAVGGATTTVPPVSTFFTGPGCGGGSFVGDLTSNNTSHGTITKTTGTSQTVTLPADVKVFVLQGSGNIPALGSIDQWGTQGMFSGGASWAKAGSTWLAVAGGGGSGGTFSTGVADGNGVVGMYQGPGGFAGNFGSKFINGSFGQGAGGGGAADGVLGVGSGSQGTIGAGGAGGSGLVNGSTWSAGGSGGVGPSGDGQATSSQPPFCCAGPVTIWGGKGSAGDGIYGPSDFGSGGGGYGGGGAGVIDANTGGVSGGGGGGSYLDPNRGWVCESGVYFQTSYTGQSITIGSSGGGALGYAKIIY